MRVFAPREVEEAVACSRAGELALHLHRIIPDRATAPACFVRAVDGGNYIAHLFCTSAARLRSAAAVLGVRVVHIDREGTDHQHLDLCGGPLRLALGMLDADQGEKLSGLLALLPGAIPV